MGDGDVQGGVQGAGPAGDEEVRRSPLGAGDDGVPLPDQAVACLLGHLVQGVAHVVVAADAFAPTPAAEGVVSQHVALMLAIPPAVTALITYQASDTNLILWARIGVKH